MTDQTQFSDNALVKVLRSMHEIISLKCNIHEANALLCLLHRLDKSLFFNFPGVVGVSRISSWEMKVGVMHRHQLAFVPDEYLGYKVTKEVWGAIKPLEVTKEICLSE